MQKKIQFVWRRERRCRHLLDDLKKTRRYWHLKEEALGCLLWRTRCLKRLCICRKTDYGRKEWINSRIHCLFQWSPSLDPLFSQMNAVHFDAPLSVIHHDIIFLYTSVILDSFLQFFWWLLAMVWNFSLFTDIVYIYHCPRLLYPQIFGNCYYFSLQWQSWRIKIPYCNLPPEEENKISTKCYDFRNSWDDGKCPKYQS
jgi:hypothetical protein